MLNKRFIVLWITFTLFNAGVVYASDGESVSVRVAHFSVDTPAVSLRVNNQTSQIQSLEFSDVSHWYSLPGGTYTLTFHDVVTGEAIASSTATLSDRSRITLAIIGSSARDTVTIHPIFEDCSEISVGEARLSVFHAIEGTPAVDLLVNDNALFQFVSYPGTAANSQNNDGIATTDIVANTYTMRLTENTTEEAILNLGELALSAGNIYLIAIIGSSDHPTFLVISDMLPPSHQSRLSDLRLRTSPDVIPQLRIGHFASGTPDIDVYINGARSDIRGLRFSAVTPFFTPEEIPQTLHLVPKNETLAAALLPPIDISTIASPWLTIAIIGSADNDTLRIILLEEDFTTIPDFNARISVFQAIPGISPVDVLIDEVIRIRLLGYPGSQGNNDGFESFDILEGSRNLQVRSSADPEDILVDLTQQDIIAGRSYFVATIRAEPPYVFAATETTPP